MAMAILLGIGLTAITVVIHSVGTAFWLRLLWRRLPRLAVQPVGRTALRVLVLTVVFILMLHFLEITVWATVYWALPNTPSLATFEDAVYFSMVSFATLGYGDIVLTGHWRLLGAVESLVGIIHVGWSTTLMFSIVQYLLRAAYNAQQPASWPVSEESR